MTPAEKRRREVAAERAAYTAVMLEEAVLLVKLRTESLEDRLTYAAGQGITRAEAEAITEGLGDQGGRMLDRVYEGKSA